MAEVFLKILNMSISATWLVLAVLALRLCLKKAPRWIHVLLWGIVAARLLCPVSIESALSLIPSAQTVSPDIMMDRTPQISTGIPVLNAAVNPLIAGSFTPAPMDSANPLQIWIPVTAAVWILGMGVMTVYAAATWLRLRRRVSTATRLYGSVFCSAHIPSPFVLGIFRPQIYLPFGMTDADMAHVIAHEQTHIRRCDHWWKPLGFMLLTIHWFNPLMWIAYILLCRDIELACDEKVIKELGRDQRADYSQALLQCSVNRRMIAACPLAFGEVGVRARVKNVLHYRKPAFWVIATALILCAAVAVCFLTDPRQATIYDIYSQDGYTVLSQREIDVTLYVQKADLPEAVYTAEGYDFEENEVVVYSTPTTRIFLDKVMLSNESDDLLYFCFNCSYDLPKAGCIVTQFEHIEAYDGMKTRLNLRSKDLKDTNTTYPDALAIRGFGPGTQFDLYVSKEACMAANGTLKIDIVCNELIYAEEGAEFETQSATENQTVMEPSHTNLRGLVAGYLFVPIDGLTYRYALTDTDPENVTADELLDTCTEQSPMEGVIWEVYSLREYPDRSKLLLISGTHSAWLCEYAPAKQAADGALEAVKEAGFVVTEDGRLTSGSAIWELFYKSTQEGIPAFVSVAHYYTLDPDRTAPDTYEAYQQDYPALYIHELSFDGEVFVLRTQEEVMVYEYLMKYTASGTSSVTSTEHEIIDRYVLTHDNTYTWDQLWHSLASSAVGAAIEHHTICNVHN